MTAIPDFAGIGSALQFNGTRRTCSPPGVGGLKCLPCNGPLTCAPGAALVQSDCGSEPISAVHGTIGSAGQRFHFVPAGSGGAMQIKSIMSAAGSELCVTADSYSVVLLPCEARNFD